ncbi:MAG: 6-phosphogluconate dehydrogenase, partial [Candidatus Latescibacterota bacterium]
MSEADIGLIGLAVMGENLVLNMANHGHTVAVYNRTTSKVDDFINGRAQGKPIIGTHTVEELISKLKSPRRVMIMVQAGSAVDAVIDSLVPLLDEGDIIIDGGNTHFPDTVRRSKDMEEKGILYIGTGVSGGEEGALIGPSIMPGGNEKAWPHVKTIFQDISAKVDDGSPCCDWVGEGGAGHYVKMIHNGIEYGDMQMICEIYQVMKTGLGLSNEEMHEVFKDWNTGLLDSYLIEITRDIFGYQEEDGTYTLDKILDKAGQKGTGKWTAVSALDVGQPLTAISEAVFARCLSALKDERVKASKILNGPSITSFDGD